MSDNWENRDQIRADLNREVLEHTKSTDLKQREKMNPENVIEVEENIVNSKMLDLMINENSDTLNWKKVLPYCER